MGDASCSLAEELGLNFTVAMPECNEVELMPGGAHVDVTQETGREADSLDSISNAYM